MQYEYCKRKFHDFKTFSNFMHIAMYFMNISIFMHEWKDFSVSKDAKMPGAVWCLASISLLVVSS